MYKKTLCLFVFLLFAGYGCAAGSSSELERTVQAQGQLLIESQQRINDLQSELDTLRGQLEENTYQLNQIIERQRMILQQLGGGTPISSSSSSPSANSDDNLGSANTSSNNNTITTDNQTDPYSESQSSSQSSTPNLSSWTTSGNDKNDYNFIMQFVNDGKQRNETITAFQKFLKTYPKSSYRANANYWLGQLFYKQGKKDDASFYYATVVKDFSSSPKAADSLYKIGLIFLEKGDKTKAKAVFQQVTSKYPKDKNIVTQANKKLATL